MTAMASGDVSSKTQGAAEIHRALERIRYKLLDLTLRNKLLNHKERARTIRVVDELPDVIYDKLIDQGKSLEFAPDVREQTTTPPDDDPVQYSAELPAPPTDGDVMAPRHKDAVLQTALNPEKLGQRLKSVAAEAARAIEETGTNLLYLAIGFLEWVDSTSNQTCRAPLILVPVRLARTRGASSSSQALRYRYELNYNDEDLEANICLAQKLAADYDIVLPTLPEDDFELNPEEYFTQVSNAIGEREGWRVAREMVVDLFSFAKLFMYLDLDRTHWPDRCDPSTHHVLLDLLVGREGSAQVFEEIYDIDNDERATRVPLVYDADSAQHSAIVDVLDGHSMVIEGPPGTGKSQTITNLIAACLADGKRVLFLAEKLAALQVVKQRLDGIGLGPFVLELHSHHTNKRELLENVRQRVEYKHRQKRGAKSLAQQREAVRDELATLSKLANTAFAQTEMTVFEILWRLDSTLVDEQSDCPPIKISHLDDLTPRNMERQHEVMREIQAHLQGRVPKDNCWYGFSPTQLNPVNREYFIDELTALHTQLDALDAEFAELSTLLNSTVQPSLRLAKAIHAVARERLMDVPAPAAPTLIANLQSQENVAAAKTLHSRLSNAAQERETAAGHLRHLVALDEDAFEALEQCFQRAAELGVMEISFEELMAIGQSMQKTAQQLLGLQTGLERHRDLGFDWPRSMNDAKALAKFFEFVVDKTPAETELYLGDNIFASGLLTLLEEAKTESEALAQERKSLSRLVRFEEVNGPERLAQTIATLKEHESRALSFTNSDYRQAKRVARAVVKKSGQTTAQQRATLERLAKHLETETAFRTSARYRDGLALLFEGEDTVWDRMHAILKWAEELQQFAPNPDVLKKIKNDFVESRQQIAYLHRECKRVLKEVPSELKRLQRLCGDSPNVLLATTTKLDPDGPMFDLAERLDVIIAFTDELHGHIAERVVDSNDTLDALGSAIAAERRARGLLADIKAGEERYARILGDAFAGSNTDASLLGNHIQWIATLHDAGVDEFIVDWLCSDDAAGADLSSRAQRLADRFALLSDAKAQFDSALLAFDRYGELDGDRFFGAAGAGLTLDQVRQKIAQCVDARESLLDWSDYSRLCREACELGLSELIDAINDGRVPGQRAAATQQYALYRALANEILQRHPELNNLTHEKRRLLGEKFCDLDKEVLADNVHRVIAKLVKQKPPEGITSGRVSERTEMGLLRREMSKVKQHVPIRSLLSRAGKALSALKPCFMMSPLSVAQFVAPGAFEFDILIMDEASQLRPEECLGAIARAKQVVVVGDPNQLPPTSFFDRMADDTPKEEETTLDDVESVLDIFTQAYGTGRRLLWHYRSQHEDLIRFSNYHFYGQTLTVFPSPWAQVPTMGVASHYVECGRFKSGVNRAEAKAVATAAIDHILTDPNRSLGVGAFNGSQRDLIRDYIEDEIRHHDGGIAAYDRMCAAAEPFFVKNLENIQGDERDVILISCTYGPDPESGRVYQRFGPVTGDQGWRRLNVMFTRARQQIVVFTSMKPEDIRLEKFTSRGVVMFRRYLEYAQTKHVSDGKVHDGDAKPNDFQEVMQRVLADAGYTAALNVGLAGFTIDIAAQHSDTKDRYLLAIESDDGAAAVPSTRDRERLRPEVLTRLGWQRHHVTAVEWFKNREREAQRLLDTVAACAAEPPSTEADG